MNRMGWKSRLFYVSVIIVVTLALFKYVQYPEPYTFSTDCTEGRVRINGNQITQPIVLNDKSDWTGDAYFSIYFSRDAQPASGSVEVSLIQDGKKLSSVSISAPDIKEGFFDIKGLDYSLLDVGNGNEACIEIGGAELDRNVFLRVASSAYELPECRINGVGAGKILAQKYHFHFVNSEYMIRIALYVVFIITNIIAAVLLFRFPETKRICRMLRVCVTVSYIAATFIYDCKFLLFPIYNDVSFNYVHDAITYGTLENILATDAGYLPLIQRLIVILIFKVLHIQAYYAVYVMQFVTYVLAGYFLSFFLKSRYKESMQPVWRYLLCLLCCLSFSSGQQVFYNAIYLGIVVILNMFLTDMGKWSRWEFAMLCFLSVGICLSKGAYVALIPFMTVYIILFWGRIGKREKIYIGACSAACLVQLLYYFLYGVRTSYGAVVHWTSRSIRWGSMSRTGVLHTLVKLAYSVMIDVPNRILVFLGGSVTQLNGVGFLIVAVFWIAVFHLFYKEILIKWIRNQEVDIEYARLFLLLSFIAIYALFYRMTVIGVSDINRKTLFTFQFRGLSDKYSISITIAVICLYFCCIHILARRYRTAMKIALPLFVFSLMFSNAHLQLYGIGNEKFCAGRVYSDDNLGEVLLLKGIEDAECRTMPIMSSHFLYSRNAKTYCFGENIFNWRAEYGNRNTVDIEVINNGKDLTSGVLNLSDHYTINKECKVWQVYVSRTSLVSNEKYKVVVKDVYGDQLLSMEQDNTPGQLVTSFTFSKPVDNIGSIEIQGSDGRNVKIKNGIYLVVRSQDSLFAEE